jgi:hypothetical protein
MNVYNNKNLKMPSSKVMVDWALLSEPNYGSIYLPSLSIYGDNNSVYYYFYFLLVVPTIPLFIGFVAKFE